MPQLHPLHACLDPLPGTRLAHMLGQRLARDLADDLGDGPRALGAGVAHGAAQVRREAAVVVVGAVAADVGRVQVRLRDEDVAAGRARGEEGLGGGEDLGGGLKLGLGGCRGESSGRG